MKACIVGGGISGLTAAYRLKQAGHEVELFEASARVGGILGTERIQDCVVETGPDSILTEKPWALALAKELGLEASLIKTRASSQGAFIVHEGKLVRIPEGFSMMAATNFAAMARSPLLSLRGKLRMALDLALPRGGVPSGDESLEQFVVRRFGRETLDSLAQPLVGGIYGADPALLSLRATMPRFLDLEQQHRSVILGLRARQRQASEAKATGARYGMFVAFRGGMQEFIDALQAQLASAVHTQAPVSAVERDGQGYRVFVHGEWRAFDALVMALPAHAAATALSEFDAELSSELTSIPYASAATLTFAWSRSDVPHALDAFGFVVPAREACDVLASTWASVKYEGRAPADRALIRVFIGGYRGQHLLQRSDAELTQLALGELGKLMGITASPLFNRVVRYVNAMPQYQVGHLARVERIDARVALHPRFALAGNAYRGVGIPDAVRSAEQACAQILGSP